MRPDLDLEKWASAVALEVDTIAVSREHRLEGNRKALLMAYELGWHAGLADAQAELEAAKATILARRPS